jgi:hypothetical protein
MKAFEGLVLVKEAKPLKPHLFKMLVFFLMALSGGLTQDLPGWRLVWADEFNLLLGSQTVASGTLKPGAGAGTTASYSSMPSLPSMLCATEATWRLPRSSSAYPVHAAGTAHIELPRGQGLWPAFWILGSNFGAVRWPICVEIDIMEHLGREPRTVHGTIHGPDYSGGAGIGKPYTPADFADQFHVFALEWEPGALRWYVDGVHYQTRTPADLPEDARWVFDQPFFMILNLAVGGGWGSTRFPQRMLVDYVRVYERVDSR